MLFATIIVMHMIMICWINLRLNMLYEYLLIPFHLFMR